MTSSPSTALARIPNGHDKEAAAEKVPAISSITVPAALLLAAESVSAKPGGPRTYLEGVFLHAKGDRGRVVGTDGNRMFIASFPLPTKSQGGAPPWLTQGGLILSSAGLRPRLSLLGKLSGEQGVRVGYAKGNATAQLADDKDQSVFKVSALFGEYPDYDKALEASSFTTLDDDGNDENREWQPVGINSLYLKQCGDIAKTLEAGLEADKRSKLGMVVRAFNSGKSGAPIVLDFSTWPGAVLVVAPAVMASNVTSKETAAILAPALKATIAALRAHATRWEQRAVEAADPGEKAAAAAKAGSFRARAAAVMRSAPAGAAIGGEKHAKAPQSARAPGGQPDTAADPAAPAPDAAPGETSTPAEKPAPEPTAEEGPAPDDGVSARPATKRTRIKVPAASAEHQAAA